MSSQTNGHSPDPESEFMRYGMLGDDQATSKEKLEKYTGIVNWSYLEPHYKNEALVFVDPSLSITEVGEAFATDDADKVTTWRSSSLPSSSSNRLKNLILRDRGSHFTIGLPASDQALLPPLK